MKNIILIERLIGILNPGGLILVDGCPNRLSISLSVLISESMKPPQPPSISGVSVI
jgi:hypothetical protein